jgi:DNA polymerase-3 subunit epsilon
VDTVLMARKKFPGSPANLDALCKRFDIDLSARTLHGALLDAELLADVYLELTGGRQSKLTLRREDDIAAQIAAAKRTITLEPREFPPSEEELAAHMQFISKKVSNALWLKAE